MTTRPCLSIRPDDGRTPLVFCANITTYNDLFGLNLALTLARNPAYAPIAAIPFDPLDLVVDPLRAQTMRVIASASVPLWTALQALTEAEVDALLLLQLDGELTHAHAADLAGQPTIGIASLWQPTLSQHARQRADQLALIVAQSRWTESVVRAHGVAAVTRVLQGVDTSLYHPAPPTGLFRDRFVVFAGGDFTTRTAPDLVLRAFRVFRQRHPEAMLLTNWHTPWPQRDTSLSAATGTVPQQQTATGTVDIAAWVIGNGIPGDALVALGLVPDIAMPHVLREADVALFPSRSEGGTNPQAMACMACGIPTILSANTGHLDLLALGDVAYRLDRQTAEHGPADSDPDQIIAHLEAAYSDRAAATALGQRAATAMASLTWEGQIQQLLRAVRPLLP